MQLLFYYPYPLDAGVTLRDVLQGDVACSGSASSVRLTRALTDAGHSCEILHRLPNEPPQQTIDGVAARRMDSLFAVAEYCRGRGPESAIVVQTCKDDLELIARLASCRLFKLWWLHVSVSIDGLHFAFRRGLHRALCVSRAAAEPYRRYSFFGRVEVSFHSLRERAAFPAPHPETNRVAFVGAPQESTGFHHLLRAWPLVTARVPQATLDVYGSVHLHDPRAAVGTTGVLSREFEGKYWRPDAAGSIRLHGQVSKSALFAGLARASVGVVNSNVTGITETFCLSAVEMQACGCPTVGGGAGGLLDTIADGVTGFHLRSQAPEELAGRLVQVLQDEALQKRLSAGALIHAGKFMSPAEEAARWCDILGRVTRGDPAPHERAIVPDMWRASRLGDLRLWLKSKLRPDASVRAAATVAG
jgi:glycosyltransferase involved in cell wall biosynthesis